MKSYVATPATIERKWYVVDATDKTLGRLASEVAKVLRGKHKPTYTPFLDTGDYVIIVNAEKFKVTGKKMNQKTYFTHSKYIGGTKTLTLAQMLEKHPEQVIEQLRECFPMELSEMQCTGSYLFTADRIISIMHRSRKSLHFNRWEEV